MFIFLLLFLLKLWGHRDERWEMRDEWIGIKLNLMNIHLFPEIICGVLSSTTGLSVFWWWRRRWWWWCCCCHRCAGWFCLLLLTVLALVERLVAVDPGQGEGEWILCIYSGARPHYNSFSFSLSRVNSNKTNTDSNKSLHETNILSTRSFTA